MNKFKDVWLTLANLGLMAAINPAQAVLAADNIDENTIPTAVKRSLEIGMWGGIGFLTMVGLIAFGLGMMKMWNNDDPRAKSGAIKQVIWGGLLSFAMLVIVAVRMFVFSGDAGVTAEDLTGVVGQTGWDEFLGSGSGP